MLHLTIYNPTKKYQEINPYNGLEMVEFPDAAFKFAYEDSFMEDEFTKRIVKEIDKSDILDSNLIKSPYLGLISPDTLSGGTKTLILANSLSNYCYDTISCGENTYKYILELGNKKDIYLATGFGMYFEEPFEIHIDNRSKIITTKKELLDCYEITYR